MKKMILFAGVLMASLCVTAQTSPYTGTTPQEGVYYIYNVQSGLWLQNNDSKCNVFQPLGNLGTRGLDINMVASGDGFLLGGGFGRNSLNSEPQTYFDSEKAVDRVWVFEPGDASVSNGYTIHCGGTYLRAVKSTWNFPAYNLFTQPLDGNNERYYLEIPANSNVTDVSLFNTWQVVSKEERLAKMVADASYDHPQDASWLVPNADFANRNERLILWDVAGFTRKGEADANWRRGNSIMQNTTPGEGILDGDGMFIQLTDMPNGVYRFNLQGFYLGGTYDEVAGQMKEGTNEQRVFYYANEKKKALMSPFDEPMCQGHTTGDGTYPLTVQKTYDEVGEFTFPPHNSDILASVMINRYCGYLNDAIEVVVTDGTLVLGVIKEGDAVANEWTVVDNFHLTYLGPDETTTAIGDDIRETSAKDRSYDLSGRKVVTPSSKNIIIRDGKKFIAK